MVDPTLPERERLLAETIARMRADVERLREASWTRSVIDTAKGVLVGRFGLTLDDAYDRLAADAVAAGTDVLTAAAVILDLGRTDPAPGATTTAAVAAPAPAARPRTGAPAAGPPAEPATAGGPGPAVPVRPALGVYHRALVACESAADGAELARHLAAAVAAVAADAAVLLAVARPDGGLTVRAAVDVPSHVLRRTDHFTAEAPTPPIAAAHTGQALWLAHADAAAQGLTLIEAPEVRWSGRAWIPVADGGRTAAVVGLLWPDRLTECPGTRRRLVRAATVAGHRLLALEPGARDDVVAGVQRILDVLPGSAALLTPVHDSTGEVVDWQYSAVTPDAVDVAGRRPSELLGRRVLEVYPTVAGTELWAAYRWSYESGVPATVGPFDYMEVVSGLPRRTRYLVRVARMRPGIVVSWLPLDTDERLASRIDRTERLGNLGWGVWHLDRRAPDEWSDQLYRIFDRDPADGPMSYEELLPLIHADDQPKVVQSLTATLEHDVRYDVEFRMAVKGEARHIRAIGEVVRDGAGSPLEIYGLMQDVTALRRSHERLESARRELEAQQQRLAEEHRLAVRLQEIILPVPGAPLDLPGMRAAVRYLPAEQAAHVGGDWYHAIALPDRSVLLAVGDVAGHGLPAASVMAQLRHALSGLTAVTSHPAEVLRALNMLLCDQVSEQTLATAMVMRYHPATRGLIWAQAGHLPCLLLRDGVVTRLARPEGLVLGAWRGARYATEHARLEPGDLLLLYTDGLVERPDLSVDTGVDQLATTMAAAADPAVADGNPMMAVLRAVRRANPDDDTCVVVAEAVGV